MYDNLSHTLETDRQTDKFMSSFNVIVISYAIVSLTLSRNYLTTHSHTHKTIMHRQKTEFAFERQHNLHTDFDQ